MGFSELEAKNLPVLKSDWNNSRARSENRSHLADFTSHLGSVQSFCDRPGVLIDATPCRVGHSKDTERRLVVRVRSSSVGGTSRSYVRRHQRPTVRGSGWAHRSGFRGRTKGLNASASVALAASNLPRSQEIQPQERCQTSSQPDRPTDLYHAGGFDSDPSTAARRCRHTPSSRQEGGPLGRF
jgi:hypothetical protein